MRSTAATTSICSWPLIRASHCPTAFDITCSVAGSIERTLEHRFQVFLEFARPAALLILGLVVGAFVVAMFMPAVELLKNYPIS